MNELSTALAAELHRAGHCVPVFDAATPPPRSLISVALLTRWSLASAAELSRHAWRGQTPCVPVRLDGALVLIGPVLGPAAGTCLRCAERARLRVLGNKVPVSVDLQLGGLVPPPAVPLLAALLGGVVADPGRYGGLVLALRTDRATVSTHGVRSDPQGCEICAPLPADTPDAANLRLDPAPTTDPQVLRGPNPRTGREHLRAALYDWRHGPVAHIARTERSALPLVRAEIVGDRTLREAGYGRALTYAEAERVAFFEAVERLAGARPSRTGTTIEASYRDLDPEVAVDPVRLGLPHPRYHDHAEFRFTPYRPDVSTTWVYGWSLDRRRPVLVPEHAAYWDLPWTGGTSFLYESSNGCGLGNSLVEAVLYGLFEVAERDAFLMAWYARTPLRRVALPPDDPMLPHLADRLETVGYRLLLFDATNDLGVPTVLALALHRDPGAAAPQAFFAAGAHPDPRAALRSAAVETVVDVLSAVDVVRERPDHFDRDRLLPMLAEPELVRTLHDHVALNTLPDARERYAFLLDDAADEVDLRDLWPDQPAPTTDLAGLLTATTERLAAAGLEVIAVNQTDPVTRERCGLFSAKVFVPGTLPMTFGHVNHRTLGLPRLTRVPFRLGRLATEPRYEDLPLHPHPFP